MGGCLSTPIEDLNAKVVEQSVIASEKSKALRKILLLGMCSSLSNLIKRSGLSLLNPLVIRSRRIWQINFHAPAQDPSASPIDNEIRGCIPITLQALVFHAISDFTR
jgi:hypothetical protein